MTTFSAFQNSKHCAFTTVHLLQLKLRSNVKNRAPDQNLRLDILQSVEEMSRKTQPCINCINEDAASCDRSVKRVSATGKKTRDCSTTRCIPEKDKVSTLFSNKVKTARAKSTSSGQQPRKQLNTEPSYSSFKGKTFNGTKEESWGQVLKNAKEQSTFSHFDPLRTLHFLIKELDCRIRNDIPGK